jgi:hypothetical protein
MTTIQTLAVMVWVGMLLAVLICTASDEDM